VIAPPGGGKEKMNQELKENPRSRCKLRGFRRVIEEVINYS